MYNAEIGLEYQTSTVNEISKDLGGSDFDFAIQQEDRNKLWTARYDFHFYKYTHPCTLILISQVRTSKNRP